MIAARDSGTLPPGYVYLYGSLTEDFELTLEAAKTLGWQTISPFGCDAATDTMPTCRKLWLQRIRWMQGGVEDLRRYGGRESLRRSMCAGPGSCSAWRPCGCSTPPCSRPGPRPGR